MRHPFGSCQRTGGDVVSAGIVVWSRLAGCYRSLGLPLSKMRVYEIVQATAARIPDLKREQVFGGVKTKALGGDLTSVKCAGQWLHLGLTVDAISGLALTIDEVSAEDAATESRLDRADCGQCGSDGASQR